MLQPSLLISALAALVPTAIGFAWYHPKLFGKAWMEGAGVTEDSAKNMNMPLVLGLSFVLSVMLSISLHMVTIHQYGLQSLIMPEKGKEVAEGAAAMATQLMEMYKGSYRTFGHGALHGAILAIFTILPIGATNAMFEHRGWKYILINAGYWTVTLAIMGGIICKFS